MKLTDRQTAVLAYLRKHDPERDSPLTGAEIAEAIWGTGVFTSLEQGARTCRQLVAKGLVVALGTSESGARCYVAAPPLIRIEWKLAALCIKRTKLVNLCRNSDKLRHHVVAIFGENSPFWPYLLGTGRRT